MSFILDALRKSETERQRQTGPGLIEAGYRPPVSRQATWIRLLVIVLAANLVAIAVVFLRRPAGSPTAPPPVPETAAVATAPASQPMPPDLVAGMPDDSDAAYATTADMPAIETPGGRPAETFTPPDAIGTPAMPGTAEVIREGLPTAAELTASGAISLPALHLDIHVYTADSTARFVFINTRKYTEGEQLAEGPRLDEITREGVVLSQAGRQFILTRD